MEEIIQIDMNITLTPGKGGDVIKFDPPTMFFSQRKDNDIDVSNLQNWQNHLVTEKRRHNLNTRKRKKKKADELYRRRRNFLKQAETLISEGDELFVLHVTKRKVKLKMSHSFKETHRPNYRGLINTTMSIMNPTKNGIKDINMIDEDGDFDMFDNGNNVLNDSDYIELLEKMQTLTKGSINRRIGELNRRCDSEINDEDGDKDNIEMYDTDKMKLT